MLNIHLKQREVIKAEKRKKIELYKYCYLSISWWSLSILSKLIDFRSNSVLSLDSFSLKLVFHSCTPFIWNILSKLIWILKQIYFQLISILNFLLHHLPLKNTMLLIEHAHQDTRKGMRWDPYFILYHWMLNYTLTLCLFSDTTNIDIKMHILSLHISRGIKLAINFGIT